MASPALRGAAVLLAGVAVVATVRTALVRASAADKPSYASQAEADVKSAGCLSCHTQTDSHTMHASPDVVLSCVDCHGGQGTVARAGEKGTPGYADAMRRAHVLPRDATLWRTSANPERSATAVFAESQEFVRFVNPGDLRAAPLACGPCHARHVDNVSTGIMTHGAMLYAAALYNNGVLPMKDAVVGESYDPATGAPRAIRLTPPPTPEEIRDRGILAALLPFPRWELGQPGNPFRVFEGGGRNRPDLGVPDREELPGRPDKGLSGRGPGTLNRTDPIILGAQKTRLVDPLLSMLGTNDHPGDYRSSGCSACHVVYANDRNPRHSGAFAAHGNRGRSATVDPTISRTESGHPVSHRFTNSIPSSQCMTCHMHPGASMVATFFGTTFWDNEVDGQVMYPQTEKRLSASERAAIERRNPEGAAVRGHWSDSEFLAELSSLNPQLLRTQFADFHGHGWVFREVYKQDRKGNRLDAAGAIAADTKKSVHLADIHLEKGMHCVDCHFSQDVHGDGNLYGEPRSPVEITCEDCHGTEKQKATLRTSGAASRGRDLTSLVTPFGKARFERAADGRVLQRSMTESTRAPWTIPQTAAAVTRLAAQAHGKHTSESMTCFACHSSFTPTCMGCHLSQRANEKTPNLHSEGGDSRNWTSYNFQTLRDDAFFLARDGWVGPNRLGADGKPVKQRIAPARSACAVTVSSQNQNRETIYAQQQMVSSAGFSAQAFSTYVPHTVRKTETKACADCHVSRDNDNNAWLASLVLQGTGLMNFIGRHAWVGEGASGFEGVVVTEQDEPQAVIGSRLHQLAYPSRYQAHVARGRGLDEAYGHRGNVRSLQLRGEYLFTAGGRGGLRIYDVAQVHEKGYSQRVSSAPVSPLGQRMYVPTRDATSVALPTTQTVDPTRQDRMDPKIRAANMEQPVHKVYDYAFVTDREEGLVVVGPLHTLLDGDPTNNFVVRAATFDGGGRLRGAIGLTLAGTVGYAVTPAGIVVLDLDKPTAPRLVTEVALPGARAIAVQLRYAFVVDGSGLKVLDVSRPLEPRLVPGASVDVPNAASIYLARTYAWIAAGPRGIAIVDVERPEHPRIDQWFDALGTMNDARDVKLGFTNGSGFAYVADGRNGLRVLQVISANDTPGAYGFSPRPTPTLVATRKTRGPALALSRGVDRDRAADESGNQIAVFGRRGAKPLSRDDVQSLLSVPPVAGP